MHFGANTSSDGYVLQFIDCDFAYKFVCNLKQSIHLRLKHLRYDIYQTSIFIFIGTHQNVIIRALFTTSSAMDLLLSDCMQHKAVYISTQIIKLQDLYINTLSVMFFFTIVSIAILILFSLILTIS